MGVVARVDRHRVAEQRVADHDEHEVRGEHAKEGTVAEDEAVAARAMLRLRFVRTARIGHEREKAEVAEERRGVQE